MADDLAEASRNGSVISVSGKNSSLDGQVAAGNVLRMPVEESEPAQKKGAFSSFIAGILIALLVSGGAWGAYVYWPKKSNTIADIIPIESMIFISIKRENSLIKNRVLPKIIEKFGLSEEDLGQSWQNLIYAVLPGGTSSEPLNAIILDKEDGVNLSANGNLVMEKLPNGVPVIIESAFSGRLDGLSGKFLGGSIPFQELSRNVALDSEYLYAGLGQKLALVRSLTLAAPGENNAMLSAFTGISQGNKVKINGNGYQTDTGKSVNMPWGSLLKAVPASAMAVSGQTGFQENADKWRLAQSNNARLQILLNSLNEKGTNIDKLKAGLAGVYVSGTLKLKGIEPDGFAVLTIKDGLQDSVRSEMLELEAALRNFGPVIGNGSYSDAVFQESLYKDVLVRFANFGDSSHAFDYAIVDSLLFVSTSKESMYSMIDAYKGEEDFTKRFNGTAERGSGWQYLNLEESTASNIPSAWETVLSGFKNVYIEPAGGGLFKGEVSL